MANNSQFCCEKKFFSHESRPLKVASSNFKTPVCLNFFFSKNSKNVIGFSVKFWEMAESTSVFGMV